MEMKGTLSGCYYTGHGRCARCPLLASAHLARSPGPHEADTVALRPPARHQPPPPRHTSASEQHVLAKIFFHFCTAIVLVPMYPMQCIAMLKIKGSTYTRFKKLHMSEVPNAIRFRETFKVHWWIKDETALSFFSLFASSSMKCIIDDEKWLT